MQSHNKWFLSTNWSAKCSSTQSPLRYGLFKWLQEKGSRVHVFCIIFEAVETSVTTSVNVKLKNVSLYQECKNRNCNRPRPFKQHLTQFSLTDGWRGRLGQRGGLILPVNFRKQKINNWRSNRNKQDHLLTIFISSF